MRARPIGGRDGASGRGLPGDGEGRHGNARGGLDSRAGCGVRVAGVSGADRPDPAPARASTRPVTQRSQVPARPADACRPSRSIVRTGGVTDARAVVGESGARSHR